MITEEKYPLLLRGATSAYTAKQTAAKATMKFMEDIFTGVKEAAIQGGFSFTVNRHISHGEIRTLQELGYGVRNLESNKWQINW